MLSRFHAYMCRLPLWKQIGLAAITAIVGPVLLVVVFGGLYIGIILLLGSIPVEYEYLHPAEQISKIEILYIENSDDTGQFDDAIVCVTLSEDQHTTFLSDLYELKWYNYGNYPPFVTEGACIRITYANGDYEILSAMGTYFSTDSDGDFTSRHLDHEELIPMLTAYGYQAPTPQHSTGSTLPHPKKEAAHISH